MGDMREFREVFALYSAGYLHPVGDRVFTPQEAVAAYTRLESGEQFGKLVIDWR